MASIKVYKQTGAEAGTMNLDDSVFAVEFNEALVHQVHAHQNRSSWRRHQAVASEGYGQSASGLYQISAVDGRRRRVRTQAP